MRSSIRFLPMLLLLSAPLPVWALKDASTEQGVRYVTGGVTQEEIAEIQKRRPLFNLSVLTVARPSGAHLADVRLVITPVGGAGKAAPVPVLDVVMEGPWLLANLAPGNYDFTATFEGKTEKQRVAVAAGRDRQVIFRIASEDQVSPDLRPQPQPQPAK
jgi:hypothetical protein